MCNYSDFVANCSRKEGLKEDKAAFIMRLFLYSFHVDTSNAVSYYYFFDQRKLPTTAR